MDIRQGQEIDSPATAPVMLTLVLPNGFGFRQPHRASHAVLAVFRDANAAEMSEEASRNRGSLRTNSQFCRAGTTTFGQSFPTEALASPSDDAAVARRSREF